MPKAVADRWLLRQAPFQWQDYVSPASFPLILPQSTGIFRYVMVDSSPQGQHDWLNVTITTLSVQQASKAYDLFLRIWQDVWVRGSFGAHLDVAHTDAITRLQELLRQHRGVPTCLASGRGSLFHKVHAYMHSLRLESMSWEMTACLYNSTVSYTTDFGTEVGFGHFPEVTAKDMFPWTCLDSLVGEEDGARAEGLQTEDVTLAQHALQVPGILHIVHNIVKDFPVVLPSYPAFLSQLQAVARLLSTPWLCQRLLHTCGSQLQEEERAVLRSFNCQARHSVLDLGSVTVVYLCILKDYFPQRLPQILLLGVRQQHLPVLSVQTVSFSFLSWDQCSSARRKWERN